MRSLSMMLAVCSALWLNDGLSCRPETVDCSDSFEPGVRVQVVDAATGLGIDNAELTLTQGEYSEILAGHAAPPGTYSGAYERAGTYTLTVQADGYRSQTIDGIVVGMTEDGCHVATVSLTVQLTPVD